MIPGEGPATMTTARATKPPRLAVGLIGFGAIGRRLAESIAAREAGIRFPENVNVAAAIALAGLGLDRSKVRVVADPTVTRNTHEIEARGEFGELRVVLQNIPTENPRTGRLTAMSIVKALRNL